MLKKIGVYRRVDELGRIVLPSEIRRIMNVDTDSMVRVSLGQGHKGIVIERVAEGCLFCGADQQLTRIHGHWVCLKCMDDLRQESAS